MQGIWELVSNNRAWLFDGLGVAVIVLIIGAFAHKKRNQGRGGTGGNASVGGSGIAIGGQGGRAGLDGHGGDGGGGQVAGDGYVRGGDGGDSGVPGRPTLGAPSPLSYIDDVGTLQSGHLNDQFGIPQPGRGGDSHAATIRQDGREYSLNVLLRLLNGPCPAIINRPQILDCVDGEFSRRRCTGEQDWWELAVRMFPIETATVIDHYDKSIGRT